jgi:hypothetical protein
MQQGNTHDRFIHGFAALFYHAYHAHPIYHVPFFTLVAQETVE